MKIKSPFDTIKQLESWFSKEKQVTFFAALLTGAATNFLLLVWGLMSQDGLCWSIRYFASDWEISLGRWGQIPIDLGRAGYSVSYLSSSLSILYMALSSIFVTAALGLKSKLSGALTGIAFAVAPGVLATLLYVNLSDAHMLALLFGCMGGYFISRPYKGIKHLIPGFLCMLASLSIYQSYIGFSLGLLMMAVILGLLFSEEDLKSVGTLFLKGFLTGLASFAAYGILTKLFQTLSGNGMSTYYGVNEIGAASLFQRLPASLTAAYKGFFQYFIRDTIFFNTPWRRHYFFMVFFGVLILGGILALLQRRLYRKPGRLIFLLLLSFLLPAGLNLIQLLVPDSELYLLTTMQMALMLPFGISVFEGLTAEKEGSDTEGESKASKGILAYGIVKNLTAWAGMLLLVPILATYYFTDILSYKALKETSDQALWGAERVLARIENTEGYEPGMPIAFAGWFFDDEFPRDLSYWEYSLGKLVINNQTHPNYGAATESIRKVYLESIGTPVYIADPASYLERVGTEEFQEMGVFPAEDSVQVMDGVMVVKLMKEPFLP